jgi:small-conductance mechanosensitive channel
MMTFAMLTIKDILEFKLIEIDKFSLTPLQILMAFLIIVITRIIVSVIKLAIRKAFHIEENRFSGKEHTIFIIIKYFLYTISVVMVLKTIGFDVTILIASSAALFVGLGFGLQDAFKDLISGILMLIEGSVHRGDVIEIDDGTVGQVHEINLRTSRVKTRDGIMIIVPNSKFINDMVINWSDSDVKTRFRVEVGVAYGSDVELVRKLLFDIANGIPEVEKNPPPNVRLANFGNSSLDFHLIFWSKDIWYIENIKSEIRYKIDKTFRENKVSIPFPQRDIHIKTDTTKEA